MSVWILFYGSLVMQDYNMTIFVMNSAIKTHTHTMKNQCIVTCQAVIFSILSILTQNELLEARSTY